MAKKERHFEVPKLAPLDLWGKWVPRDKPVWPHEHFCDKPGVGFCDGYVLFTPQSLFHTSSWEQLGTDSTGGVRMWPELHFDSVSRYFEWTKAVVFNDTKARALLEKNDNRKCRIKAKEAIEIGHRVEGYNDKVWKKLREEFMIRILLRKENPSITDLIDPKYDGFHFVNADPSDRIWGIGYSSKTAMAHKDDWGENLLGKCYDKVREILINRESDKEMYYYYTRPIFVGETYIFDCGFGLDSILLNGEEFGGYIWGIQGEREIQVGETATIVEYTYNNRKKEVKKVCHDL